MKKFLYTTAAITAIIFSTTAHAKDMNLKSYYLGVDYQRVINNYSSNINAGGGNFLNGNSFIQDSLNGGNIHIGKNFNKNFGIELGYFRTENKSKNIPINTTIGSNGAPLVTTVALSTKVKLQGVTLDGMAYLPLGDSNKFNLIGTAGVSWIRGDSKLATEFGSASGNESELGLRVGAGAEFNITNNINFRGIARYQTADFSGVLDNIWVYSLGVNYSF